MLLINYTPKDDVFIFLYKGSQQLLYTLYPWRICFCIKISYYCLWHISQIIFQMNWMYTITLNHTVFKYENSHTIKSAKNPHIEETNGITLTRHKYDINELRQPLNHRLLTKDMHILLHNVAWLNMFVSTIAYPNWCNSTM